MQNDLEMPQPFRLNSGQKAEINHNNHKLRQCLKGTL